MFAELYRSFRISPEPMQVALSRSRDPNLAPLPAIEDSCQPECSVTQETNQLYAYS